MTNDERDIQRKLRVPQHAEKIGNARKACRYFGICRSSFYRWRDAFQKHGEAGLKNARRDRRESALSAPQISPRANQQEFFQLLSYKGDVDLEAKLEEWELFYNFARPHCA